MTDIEDRLRRDLPDLADALAGVRTHRRTNEADADARPSLARRASTPMLVLAASAAVLLIAGFLVFRGGGSERTDLDTVSESLAPDGPGSWMALSDAPIDRRAFPASVWTGTEALFWAGSSLDRSFAYGDGAAYDPVADSWRVVPVPGWGHPGLVSVVVDGQLFATAKGSIGRLDVDTGEWVEISAPEGIEVRSIAAGDGGIWALGTRPGDRDRLAVAFRDGASGSWDDGDDLTGPEGIAALESLADLEQPVLWSEAGLVVWTGKRGFAYRPNEGWTALPALPQTQDEILFSQAVVHDGTIIAFVEQAQGRAGVRLFRFDPAGDWARIGDADLPVADLAQSTIADAGQSIMLLAPQGPPVSVHVASGQHYEHTGAPIQGIEGPGTVWTGTQLVVWGGVVTDADESEPGGMVWTPADDQQTGDGEPSTPVTDNLEDEIAGAMPYGPLWERLDRFPEINPRNGAPAVVWVSSRLFIWGGGDGHASMYFPFNGPAAPIPEAPIPPRRDPAAVAFDDSVLIWGGSDSNGPRSDGAIYQVDEERWRQLPPAPLPPGVPLVAAHTGDEIVVFGQQNRLGADEDLARGAAFDPSTGEWRALPDAPAAVNSGNGVWTGSELVVLGSRLDTSNAGSGPTAMAYSPATNQWRVLPDPNLAPQSTWLTTDGERLFAWDYLLDAAVLDLEAASPKWRPLPKIPLDERECYVSGGVSNSKVLVTYCGDGALLEQDASRWTVIPAPSGLGPFASPIGAVVVTDDGAWRLRQR